MIGRDHEFAFQIARPFPGNNPWCCARRALTAAEGERIFRQFRRQPVGIQRGKIAQATAGLYNLQRLGAQALALYNVSAENSQAPQERFALACQARARRRESDRNRGGPG